jgi:formylglycine-generating enzyme required for sulfatase activity
MANYETIQGLKMAVVPAGKFLMGHEHREDPAIPAEINVYFPDERPVHEETIPGFQLGATQVTQAEYERVMKVNFSSFKGADLPVTNLGPFEIRAFCNRLSQMAGLAPCYAEQANTGQQGRSPQQRCDATKNGFRMPSEREWEYACRAGTRTMFYTGNTEADLASAGWYRGNSGGKTHPVGQKTPNAWGLYDMHGNVFEFCEDDWNPSMAYGRYLPKGAAPDFAYYHTLNLARGGGWLSDAAVCRCATRSCFCNWQNINQSYYMGFRVARTVS